MKVPTSVKRIFFVHWPIILLFFFGIFLILIRAAGSLDGDEAIYAQVARESLARDSWLTLYWRSEPWFEKPPLFLWSQMMMAKVFGLSEIVLRFSSGLFGALTAALVYWMTYTFFHDRKGAFIAGVILFSLPLFIESMRYGMTDTMVTFFTTLAIFSAYQGIYRDARWLRLFGLATGAAIMTKSIVGVIPLAIFAILFIFVRPQKRARELCYAVILCALVVAPWHLYMSIVFGAHFWQDYLGYHIVDRFADNIIASPYKHYGQVALERFGIWLVISSLLLFVVRDFFTNYKRITTVLFCSAIGIIFVFSLADTVSPHYILPAMPLFSVLIGGVIGMLFDDQHRFAIIIAAATLFNLLLFFVLRASDFGGSNIFVPRIIDHFTRFSVQTSDFISVVGILFFLLASFFFYASHKKYVLCVAFFVVIGMNIFVPFYPERSAQMKEVGSYISSRNDQMLTHVFMSESKRHLTNTLLFYLPLGVISERIRQPVDPLLEKTKVHALCVILKNDVLFDVYKNPLYTFVDGAVFACESKKNAVTENERQNIADDSSQKIMAPLDRVVGRITKKPFGILIDPDSSPVQPERFSGYHSGTDFEVFDDELDEDVAVKAICDGEIVSVRRVNGYGGVIMQSCAVDGEDVRVLYGHVSVAKATVVLGQKVSASENITVLGAHKSDETDGERKHLHLGITRGRAVDIRGYVQSERELVKWLDFEALNSY